MNVTNVLLGTVCFNFNAIDSVAVVSNTANALITVKGVVKLAISKRMAIVDDVARD